MTETVVCDSCNTENKRPKQGGLPTDWCAFDLGDENRIQCPNCHVADPGHSKTREHGEGYLIQVGDFFGV